jgi:hypothetical protein
MPIKEGTSGDLSGRQEIYSYKHVAMWAKENKIKKRKVSLVGLVGSKKKCAWWAHKQTNKQTKKRFRPKKVKK